MGLSGLRYMESKIKKFEEWESPLHLEEPPHDLSSIGDPNIILNNIGSTISDSCVNSAVRVSTALPTIAYDVFKGIADKNGEQLKDAAVTLPKAVVHLCVDTLKVAGTVSVTCVLAGGILAGGTLALAAAMIYYPIKGVYICSKKIYSH